MTESKYWKRRAASIAEVMDDNARDLGFVADPLEETQDIDTQSVSGIWRRNATGEFVSAMSRSERFVSPHINLTRKQAE